MAEPITTDQAPGAIGPYSQAVKSGGFIFVSVQLPFKPGSDEIPETIEAEVKQSITNIKNILEAAGSSLAKVVRVGIFLTDLADFARANEVYSTFFHAHHPARVTVQVSALPKGARVEIDAVAEV